MTDNLESVTLEVNGQTKSFTYDQLDQAAEFVRFNRSETKPNTHVDWAEEDLMDRAEATQLVKRIRDGIENLRSLVWELDQRQGWKALGYASWRDCVLSEFGDKTSITHLYRLYTAAEIEAELSPIGDTHVGLIPEGSLRPLSAIPQGERKEVWDQACKAMDPKSIAEYPPAKIVKGAVNDALRAKKPKATADQLRDVVCRYLDNKGLDAGWLFNLEEDTQVGLKKRSALEDAVLKAGWDWIGPELLRVCRDIFEEYTPPIITQAEHLADDYSPTATQDPDLVERVLDLEAQLQDARNQAKALYSQLEQSEIDKGRFEDKWRSSKTEVRDLQSSLNEAQHWIKRFCDLVLDQGFMDSVDHQYPEPEDFLSSLKQGIEEIKAEAAQAREELGEMIAAHIAQTFGVTDQSLPKPNQNTGDSNPNPTKLPEIPTQLDPVPTQAQPNPEPGQEYLEATLRGVRVLVLDLEDDKSRWAKVQHPDHAEPQVVLKNSLKFETESPEKDPEPDQVSLLPPIPEPIPLTPCQIRVDGRILGAEMIKHKKFNAVIRWAGGAETEVPIEDLATLNGSEAEVIALLQRVAADHRASLEGVRKLNYADHQLGELGRVDARIKELSEEF